MNYIIMLALACESSDQENGINSSLNYAFNISKMLHAGNIQFEKMVIKWHSAIGMYVGACRNAEVGAYARAAMFATSTT